MFSFLCHHYGLERSLVAFTRIHWTASNSVSSWTVAGCIPTADTSVFGGGIDRWPLATEAAINSLDFVLLALVLVQCSGTEPRLCHTRLERFDRIAKPKADGDLTSNASRARVGNTNWNGR